MGTISTGLQVPDGTHWRKPECEKGCQVYKLSAEQGHPQAWMGLTTLAKDDDINDEESMLLMKKAADWAIIPQCQNTH
jgi:hypothetical protein